MRFSCVFIALAALHCDAVLAADRPNIVVILADDLGYGDVSCNNAERGKLKTSHIDRLAAEGMRFTDGHSSSGVCSPSRYALLTGRYHWRTRLQSGIVGVWGAPLIAADRLTIATLAKQQGYLTACIGKWHLGWKWPITAQQMPHFAGLGGKAGGGGIIATNITDSQRAAWREVFSQTIAEGPTTRGFDSYFGTDVPNWPPYCFIENNRTSGVPSELLPAEKLVRNQASLQGPALADWQFEPILPALVNRACRFIEDASKSSSPFLLYLPLTTPHTPLAVSAEWRGKSNLHNDCADLILETDAAVGRVLDTLSAAGVADNTLVLFTSDNGFAAYAGAKELESRGHFPSGPLRGYKSEVYEGGHRIPFIVRWPKIVKGGSVSNQLVHHADLLATLAEIFETRLPDNAGEDSFSLLPLLRGSHTPTRPNAVSCSSIGIPGIRDGSWKLILTPEVQLYELSTDIGESQNLADKHPERVQTMRSLYQKLIADGRSTPGPVQKNDVEVASHPVRPRSKNK